MGQAVEVAEQVSIKPLEFKAKTLNLIIFT